MIKRKKIGLSTTVKTFLYGLQLDIAFSGYLSTIPFLLIIFSLFLNPKKILKIVKWYTFIVILCITILLFIDAGLYQAWGVRLDTSLLTYLNTPELMIASTSTFQLVGGILGWLMVSYGFIKIFHKFYQKKLYKINKGTWLEIPLFLLITAALIIPVRGGFQTIPVNQSNVYFSDKMFANHAAINFIWNFFNALTHKTDGTNPYIYFDDKTATNVINKTRNELLETHIDSVLTIKKPNILLIIWESLPAKIVGSLGGEPNVTPNLK